VVGESVWTLALRLPSHQDSTPHLETCARVNLAVVRSPATG
jgi:hypothetical protein